MESGLNWEQKTLINELTQGMEIAKQLKFHLSLESSGESETREVLVQRIISSYDRALLILNWSGSVVQSQPWQPAAASSCLPESPAASVDGSPWGEVFDRGLKDHQYHSDASKKRKMMPRWTDQVRISSENGLEGPQDDGYSWRKYGQKDILGCKYPRSYYRCTYRNMRDCWATKQVQRSDEDPNIFEITYRGRHTCMQGSHSNPPPATPENQEPDHQSFRNGLRVITENLDNKEITSPFEFSSTSGFGIKSENHVFSPYTLNGNNPLSSFQQSFISPSAAEANSFPFSSCQMSSFGGAQMLHHSESDLTEIMSANTSATNSPILDLEFSLEPVPFHPTFPFDSPGFFS